VTEVELTHPWSDLIDDQEREVIERGRYGMRSPLGSRPALLLIDIQPTVVGLDRPILEQISEYPSGIGAEAHRAIRRLVPLVAAARDAEVPVIYTRLVTGDGVGMYGDRIDREPLLASNPSSQVVEELAPEPGDIVLEKHLASAFFGTALSFVLTRLRVDTLLIGGGSTSGCVRASAVDAASHGYRVAVIEDGTFDRIRLSHAASLLDIWMKYGELISAGDAARYLHATRQEGIPT
jgi:nicotinamidase-related amidase